MTKQRRPGRPRAVLTAKESKIISAIKVSAEVPQLWQNVEKANSNAHERRMELGKVLRVIRDRLATAGCKGLFTKYLSVRGIPHTRAYNYIGMAGGGKTNYDRPSHKRRMTIFRLLNTITQSKTVEDKRKAFKAVCHFIRTAYGVS